MCQRGRIKRVHRESRVATGGLRSWAPGLDSGRAVGTPQMCPHVWTWGHWLALLEKNQVSSLFSNIPQIKKNLRPDGLKAYGKKHKF